MLFTSILSAAVLAFTAFPPVQATRTTSSRLPPQQGTIVYAVNSKGNSSGYRCSSAKWKAREQMCGYDFTFKDIQGLWECEKTSGGDYMWTWKAVCNSGWDWLRLLFMDLTYCCF